MRLKSKAVGLLLACLSSCQVLLAIESGAIDPLSFSAPFNYPELKWETDFDTAKAIASRENKPLFILFGGSDWCTTCIELKKSTFSAHAFIEKVNEHFVFVDIDFPLHQRLDPELISKNQMLKKQLHVEGFPTVVIMLPNGDALTFAGQFSTRPAEAAQFFLKAAKQAEQFEVAMSHFSDTQFSSHELEEMYTEARRLGRNDYAQLLLQKGIDAPENAFFLKERYRELVGKGEMDSSEAQKIREELLAQDPDNSKGHHLLLAVIEFQSLAKGNAQKKEMTSSSSPLHSYLEGVGQTDARNRWKVELMLAHFLMTMGETDKAVEFAKAALERAPDHLKPEIETSIQKMSPNSN